MRDLVEVAFRHVDLNWEDHIVIDQEFYRPAEVDHLLGDPTKARKELEWEPEVDFEQLVTMMVDADMDRVAREKQG